MTNSYGIYSHSHFYKWQTLIHYKIGDLVESNNVLYRCKKEHTSSSDFIYDITCHDYWERVSSTYIKQDTKQHVQENKKIIKKHRKVFLFD